MRTRQILIVTLLCAVVPVAAQIIPKDATEPVEVHQANGDFAKKLNGVVMPTGKGWKPVMDPARRLQIMLPDKWKVVNSPEIEATITAMAPGQKDSAPVLLVNVFAPRDADPFEIDEVWAQNYAKEIANDPQYKKLKFQLTDSGHVLMRGMKFALAGGTMVDVTQSSGKKKPKSERLITQEQLTYIGEDRLVVLQFSAPAADFPRYADEVAKIFASYQNLGVTRIE